MFKNGGRRAAALAVCRARDPAGEEGGGLPGACALSDLKPSCRRRTEAARKPFCCVRGRIIAKPPAIIKAKRFYYPDKQKLWLAAGPRARKNTRPTKKISGPSHAAAARRVVERVAFA